MRQDFVVSRLARIDGPKVGVTRLMLGNHWTRTNETGPCEDDRTLDRRRLRMERTINRLERVRRIASCDDKLVPRFLTMLTIAMILGWL
jgi:transposase